MSMAKNVLVIAGGFFLLRELAYGLAAQLQSRIDVTPRRIRVRFNWATPSFVYLDITFQVDNRNPVGGTANGFQGALFYGATKLGNISLAGPITIPPDSSTDIEMTAQISLQELPLEIATLVTTGQFLGTLRVQGTLYTSYVNIPIDQNVPIA